tara:strand:- start:367 stop:816 length:450 start_codon:yes stop_codon:yes gene_type:complete
MKNKILLLLVLLIPSLCFGTSVKYVISELVDASTDIEINMTGEKDFKVKFITERSKFTPKGSSYVEMLIDFNKNKDEISKFLKFCKEHFPKGYEDLSEEFMLRSDRLIPVHFIFFFEDLLIQNNYAVTYKFETREVLNISALYFYKPDN